MSEIYERKSNEESPAVLPAGDNHSYPDISGTPSYDDIKKKTHSAKTVFIANFNGHVLGFF